MIYQLGPENIGMYSCAVHTSDNESDIVTAWLNLIGNVFNN